MSANNRRKGVICKTCKGTGKTSADTICTTCGGRGWTKLKDNP